MIQKNEETLQAVSIAYDGLANESRPFRWDNPIPLTADIREGDMVRWVPLLRFGDDNTLRGKRALVLWHWRELQRVVGVETVDGYYGGCRIIGFDKDQLRFVPIGDFISYSVEWENLKAIDVPERVADSKSLARVEDVA